MSSEQGFLVCHLTLILIQGQIFRCCYQPSTKKKEVKIKEEDDKPEDKPEDKQENNDKNENNEKNKKISCRKKGKGKLKRKATEFPKDQPNYSDEEDQPNKNEFL